MAYNIIKTAVEEQLTPHLYLDNIPIIPPERENYIIPTVVEDISQLARRFNLNNVQVIQPRKENYIVPENSDNPPDAPMYKSALGTPVMVDLTFHGTSYVDETGMTYSFPDFTLVTILALINQQKNIVKTAIQGRKGTVKEYLGLGDYYVTLNGIITGSNGSYPKFDVQTLKTILCCNKPVTITSWYLQMFDITSLVIESYDINQDEGYYSQQAFSIQCVSDQSANLRF